MSKASDQARSACLELVEGDRASIRIADALAQVGAVVPYLRAQFGAPDAPVNVGTIPDEGEWMLCDELIANPTWLEATIRSSGARIETSSGAVASSLFVLGYSYRVITLAVASFLLAGVIPDSAPGSMAIALKAGRPSPVAYRRPKALVVTAGAGPVASMLEDEETARSAFGFLIDTALESHLRALIVATHGQIRVGRRLLWGNVAASAAVAFRTMEGLLGPWVIPHGERFFELVPAELSGQGSFLLLENAGRRGWFWERTNCCLNDRLPPGIRCGDCSLTPEPKRRAAYLESLASS